MDPVFASIAAAAEEIWHDASYSWDNSRRPEHDACVIQRTLTGRLRFTTKGKSTFAAAEEAVLFTHREASSYGYPPEDTGPYRLQFVAFHPGTLRPLFDSLRREFGAVVKMPAKSDGTLILDEIVRLQRKRGFRDRLHVTELISQLLLALHREQIAAKQNDDPIDYGYRLVNDRAASPRTLKDIARLAGVSREHFVREYTRRYGETPGVVLRRIRLEHARAMVLTSSLSQADIAAVCGFGSGDALRRSFEQHFGYTPLALRQRPEIER